MAIVDIVAQTGDGQDFVLEIPTGNASYTPADVVMDADDKPLCNEIPQVTGGGGGNIFIMSE